jgi:2-desacetyl-2-hydroxyethyl bacteriochlorophyllide A dehydrogenase
MKTVVLEEPGRFRMMSAAAPPKPGALEALVKVRRIGVCGTDFHAFRGKQPFFRYPRVLGHELAVQIEELGDGAGGLAPGDWCALRPYVDCGQCIACRRGKPNCCVNLSVLGVHADGGLCEHLTVPSRLLHKSSVLSPDQLALVEPLSIGAHAVARAQLQPEEHVLVLGAGPIGLATAQFAIAANASVMVFDLSSQRLDFCRRHLTAARCLDPVSDSLEQIVALTSGDLPTAVFDCTGSISSMNRSFHFVAHGGRLIFVGIVQDDLAVHDPHFHRRELTLLASRNATQTDFDRVLRLIESGRIDAAPWITHRCAFDAFIDEFPRWTSPDSGVIKALIEL